METTTSSTADQTMTHVTNLGDQVAEQSQEETDESKLERFREQVMSWLGYTIKRKRKKISGRRMTTAEEEHSRLRKKYLKGIGCWFFETEQYQRWLNGNCSTLVCPGIPGSGKTMLASEVVDRLNDISSNQDVKGSIGVAFAYLDAERGDVRSTLRFMTQLTSQLVENCPWSDVLQDTESRIQSTSLSLEAVTVLAHKVGKSYHQVYIVIDALDELNSARKGANEAIASLQDLQRNFGAKLLFTLRNVPDVIGQLQEDGRIDIQAKEEDISTIVDRELQNIDIRWFGERLRFETLRHDLKKSRVLSSNNMFSLAEQAIRRLSEGSLETVKAFISSPSESSALGSFYSQEARRIMEQHEDYAKLACQVISLMSFAERNLTMPEMQHALAVNTSQQSKGQSILSFDDKGVANALISSCRGLLKVKSKSQKVTWVHDSASVLVGPNSSRYFQPDTLQSFQGKLRTPSFLVNKLQNMCIACLAHSEFKSGPCRNDGLLRERLTRYPFYRYACKYWAQHVSPLEDKNKELLWRFLEDD
ncbi:unnamed protein product [Alternaria alternata]